MQARYYLQVIRVTTPSNTGKVAKGTVPRPPQSERRPCMQILHVPTMVHVIVQFVGRERCREVARQKRRRAFPPCSHSHMTLAAVLCNCDASMMTLLDAKLRRHYDSSAIRPISIADEPRLYNGMVVVRLIAPHFLPRLASLPFSSRALFLTRAWITTRFRSYFLTRP